MTSFFIKNICEVVFLVFLNLFLIYGLWLCVCCFFQHQFWGHNCVLNFYMYKFWVFSFYVMLKIDDRFRYLGYELDPRSINCFDVILCFQFLFVYCVGIFFQSSMVKLIANTIKNGATLMYVLNINNITKDVGCMFWVELIQIQRFGR